MPKYKIPPTKANLLKLKRNYEFVREGHQLLDQKRKILIMELTSIIDITDRLQKKVDELLATAFKSLKQAVIYTGRLNVKSLSYAVDIDTQINISQKIVMGVVIPVLDTKTKENPPFYSLGGTSFWIDEAVKNFKEALAEVIRLAQFKTSLLRLAHEVKKTLRRVNALEKIYIPDYEETLKYISDVLEEQERESFAILKLTKKRLQAKGIG